MSPPRIALQASLLLVVGCVDVVPDLEPLPWDEDQPLVRLIPTTSRLDLTTGGKADLGLSALYEDALEPVPVLVPAAWATSNPLVAEVSTSGEVTGVEEGYAAVWATLGGVQSDPVAVHVGRSAYSVEVNGRIARQGKLLHLQLTAEDVDFAAAGSVELSIPGLMPFGQDRTTDPWWGPLEDNPNEYQAVFLVPPTTPPGALPITLRLDGTPPTNPIEVEIQANESLAGPPLGCSYFNDEDESNWTSSTGGNIQARTWLVGGFDDNTLLRFISRSRTSGDVDPWMALWSLEGDLLLVNEAGHGAGGTDEAAIEATAMQADLDGAWYLTSAVDPAAVASQTEGTLVTACHSHQLPPAKAEATDGFPEDGIPLLPGSTVQEFDMSAFAGSVARVYAYIDTDLARVPGTTVRVRTPDGAAVSLIDGAWAAEVGVEAGARWLGSLGAPPPFLPTADDVAGGADGAAIVGEVISGVWEIEVDVQSVGELGSWYGAALWVETL